MQHKTTVLILLFVLTTTATAWGEVVIKQNPHAVQAIGLLAKAEKHLQRPEDAAELAQIKRIIRKLTKRHIIRNLRTMNIRNEVEKYLGDTIYTSAGGTIPVRVGVKRKREEQEKKKEETPIDELNRIRKGFQDVTHN